MSERRFVWALIGLLPLGCSGGDAPGPGEGEGEGEAEGEEAEAEGAGDGGCTPQCAGSDECGDDGCGDVNGCGECPEDEICQDSQCEAVPCESHADCPRPDCGSFGACSWPSDACAEAGTKSRTCTDYACAGGKCVADEYEDDEPCERDTDGDSCGAGEGAWSACDYSGECDEAAEKSRTVHRCADGSCEAATETDPCSRDTDGDSCGAGEGSWGACGGFSDDCDESGIQTKTVWACSGGTCQDSTPSQGCSRDTGGDSCGAGEGSWGSCGDFSDDCDESGTQTKTVWACSGGSCESTMPSQGCSRDTDGDSCGSGGTCDGGECCEPYCPSCRSSSVADGCDGTCSANCSATCSGSTCCTAASTVSITGPAAGSETAVGSSFTATWTAASAPCGMDHYQIGIRRYGSGTGYTITALGSSTSTSVLCSERGHFEFVIDAIPDEGASSRSSSRDVYCTQTLNVSGTVSPSGGAIPDNTGACGTYPSGAASCCKSVSYSGTLRRASATMSVCHSFPSDLDWWFGNNSSSSSCSSLSGSSYACLSATKNYTTSTNLNDVWCVHVRDTASFDTGTLTGCSFSLTYY